MNIKANNWTVNLNILQELQDQEIMVRRFKDGRYIGWYSSLISVKNLFGNVNIQRDAIGQPVLYSDLEASQELSHLNVERLIDTDLPIAIWYNNKLLAYRDDNQIAKKLGQPAEKILKEVG